MVLVNLHTLPAGQHLYTVAVTDDAPAPSWDELAYDEVDVVAPARASLAQIVAAADLSAYPGQRVVGVIDQSTGDVLASATDGDLR